MAIEPGELKAWLRLALTPGVGNETARKLLTAFGSPAAVFEQSTARLHEQGWTRLASAIQTEPDTLGQQLQTTLAWLEEDSARSVIPLGDARYPAALLNIEDPPLMLYTIEGPLKASTSATKSIASEPCLAIVGSRNPTPQGQINARQFAKTFTQSGLCVVSGLALGIDTAAHEGALLGAGPTIAVVGTGLDRVYPKKNLALARQIAEQGMLISEFHLGTPALASNFPKRNRIISGLSLGTLVVEATLQSGSLITARLAAEQGKEVFAIPGSIHSPQARGCHWLIKQGAKLVESAQDVLQELPAFALKPTAAAAGLEPLQTDTNNVDSPAQDALLQAMGFDATHLDALQARTGWPTEKLQAALLELELGEQVARLPGGQFQRIGHG